MRPAGIRATPRWPSTTGILEALNQDELEGVIAHELAHIKHRDTLLQTVVASMVGLVAMLATQARWGMLFFGGGRNRDNNPLALVGILFVAILAPIAAMIVRGLISQQREFAADAGGAKMCGNPAALASALRTIERRAEAAVSRGGNLGVNATEHLYFINHFSLGGVGKLFSSHPPTRERVERLLEMSNKGIR